MKSDTVSSRSESGSIRLPAERSSWIPILHRIYEFESSRVSGPGSSKRDIRDILWTFAELISALGLEQSKTKEYRAVIDWMIKNRHAMAIENPDGRVLHITRVAETVRLLGHAPEYWHRGRPGIDAVRWLVEYKQVPKRDILLRDFETHLENKVVKHLRPEWKRNVKSAAEKVLPKVAEAIAERAHLKQTLFSQFQVDATVEMLLAEFGEGQDKPSQVITAGVGSGKTFAFLIPLLISSYARLVAGETERRTALLIYPRTALSRDQNRVVQRIVEKIGHPLLQVHFEHYDFYKSQQLTVKEGLERTYSEGTPSPCIIVTTLETLRRRLNHQLFVRKVASRLNRVVLDEVHLVEGLSGGNIIRLMDRLRALCEAARSQPEMFWTASSATVASPHIHASTVFGLLPTKVKVIQQPEDKMENVGLIHHVFLRPSGRISNLGAIVNATSILVHNRRVDIGSRKKGDIQKTLGFADNLDLLGRWNADFRENERTEESRDRKHPESMDREVWKVQQREVPYAIRFRRPLESRIGVEGGEGQPYEPILTEYREKKLCERCKNGERISLGERNPQIVHELSKLVYRRPHKKKDDVRSFYIRSPIFNESQEIGTMDLCPYLRAGACYWFPKETEDVELIPGTDRQRRYEWKSIARSKIHSAKTKSEFPEEDLAEVVFRAPASEIYDIEASPDPIPIDVVLASPSLEVGIDLENVTESVMFHAIRNVASYRQKAGRIGREEGSDALNATLVAERPVELHFYRQPRKLISLAQLDPLPLKDTNEAILRSALYMSVWDWLALKGGLSDAIPLRLEPDGSEFSQVLSRSLTILRNCRDSIAEHLQTVSRRGVSQSSPSVREAIGQVESELEFLLSDVSALFAGNVLTLADIVPNILSKHGKKIMPSNEAKGLLDYLRDSCGYDRYMIHRSKINPIALGLSDEFRQLDLMAKCGWTAKSIQSLVAALESKIRETGLSKEDKLNLPEVLEIVKKVNQALATYEIDPLPLYFYTEFRRFADRAPSQAHYLSYIMENLDIFRLFKRAPEYCRTKNLFTSPHEEEVALTGMSDTEELVPLSEALYSLVPGTWTYRFGKRALKIKSGRVRPSGEGVLSVSFDELTTRGGCQVVRLRQNVPGPWGLQNTFDIVRPVRVEVIQRKDKYVTLNRATGTVMDGDESEARGEEERGEFGRVKIPKTYLNRWVDIDPGESEQVTIARQDISSLAILNSEGKVEARGEKAMRLIKHPLAAALLSGVFWHKRLRATEFVYSCSRSYTSLQVSGVELDFAGPSGSPMAFGRTIETEGLSIELEPSAVERIQESIGQSIMSGANAWAATALKFFSYYLTSVGTVESPHISPYVIRDLVGVVCAGLHEKEEELSLASLNRELEALVRESDRFQKLAMKYYRGSSILERGDTYAVRPNPGEDAENTSRDETELAVNVQRLTSALEKLSSRLVDIAGNLKPWLAHTLLNSFGTAASNALQRLAGVTDDVIGYAVDFPGVKLGRYRVFLYDKDALGSGSCDVVRRFMHILHIQRHCENVDSTLLPSDDFFTLLEEELLQCPQHHTDISALEMFAQSVRKRQVIGIPILGYVDSQAREVLNNAATTWEQLGIQGRLEAWRLPVLRQQVQTLASNQLEVDDLIRATSICWNGCPECLFNRETGGGLVGEMLLDKAVLDEWFRFGRTRSKEYVEVDLEKLARGEINLPYGRLSAIVLDLPNRRVRSSSLPYTIGIEALRSSSQSPHVIIRTSDIEGFSLFETAGGEPTLGIESLGFKRLFWHDLVMTAYLDLLGMLPVERRNIQAVFYDCRDINFEDVGLSARMLDAIAEHARSIGELLEAPEKLSDILAWLAKRGFTIALCVEKTRLEEEGVKNFVRSLKEAGCNVVSKDLGGIMHKKAIVTPMGAIEGSANLTLGGTRMNEEIVNYAQWGTQGYKQVQTAVRDTFQGAVPIG
jgi:hypothetical protein